MHIGPVSWMMVAIGKLADNGFNDHSVRKLRQLTNMRQSVEYFDNWVGLDIKSKTKSMCS